MPRRTTVFHVFSQGEVQVIFNPTLPFSLLRNNLYDLETKLTINQLYTSQEIRMPTS
jgi:hypothetical protein